MPRRILRDLGPAECARPVLVLVHVRLKTCTDYVVNPTRPARCRQSGAAFSPLRGIPAPSLRENMEAIRWKKRRKKGRRGRPWALKITIFWSKMRSRTSKNEARDLLRDLLELRGRLLSIFMLFLMVLGRLLGSILAYFSHFFA